MKKLILLLAVCVGLLGCTEYSRIYNAVESIRETSGGPPGLTIEYNLDWPTAEQRVLTLSGLSSKYRIQRPAWGDDWVKAYKIELSPGFYDTVMIRSDAPQSFWSPSGADTLAEDWTAQKLAQEF